jgi:hypothetical protein
VIAISTPLETGTLVCRGCSKRRELSAFEPVSDGKWGVRRKCRDCRQPIYERYERKRREQRREQWAARLEARIATVPAGPELAALAKWILTCDKSVRILHALACRLKAGPSELDAEGRPIIESALKLWAYSLDRRKAEFFCRRELGLPRLPVQWRQFKPRRRRPSFPPNEKGNRFCWACTLARYCLRVGQTDLADRWNTLSEEWRQYLNNPVALSWARETSLHRVQAKLEIELNRSGIYEQAFAAIRQQIDQELRAGEGTFLDRCRNVKPLHAAASAATELDEPAKRMPTEPHPRFTTAPAAEIKTARLPARPQPCKTAPAVEPETRSAPLVDVQSPTDHQGAAPTPEPQLLTMTTAREVISAIATSTVSQAEGIALLKQIDRGETCTITIDPLRKPGPPNQTATWAAMTIAQGRRIPLRDIPGL